MIDSVSPNCIAWRCIATVKPMLIRSVIITALLAVIVNSNIAVSDSEEKWYVFNKPSEYYHSEEAIRIANNIVFLQRATGGWNKTIDPSKPYDAVTLREIQAEEIMLSALYDHADATQYNHSVSSFDNGSTHNHLRYLLRVAVATDIEKYQVAAVDAIHYILAAQKESGGWPQNYPNMASYGGYTTFNDGAMVGVMMVLQEVINGHYTFINDALVEAAAEAFAKGIDYIIASQIVIDEQKTAWAQQYADDFQPAQGRTYEPAAIASYESVGIVKLLMSIEQPSAEVIEAVNSAVDWLDAVKITGIMVERYYSDEFIGEYQLTIKEDPAAENTTTKTFQMRGYDKIVVDIVNAQPIWARFYHLDTQRAIFSDWDEQIKENLADISYERRTGYAWYGYWPKNLIAAIWSRWKTHNTINKQQ